MFWLHFPAILKGWFERVFAYGSAYSLTIDGWQGHCRGRVPLMHHEKALAISTTLFCEEDYKADWELPMRRIIDDWGLRYPGVKHVEHVYFYEAAIATMALGGDAIADDVNKFNRVLNLSHDLARWFEAQFGSTKCRTLTGCDFATAHGVHAYIEHDGTTECARIARLVAERVADLIAQAAQAPAPIPHTRRQLGSRYHPTMNNCSCTPATRCRSSGASLTCYHQRGRPPTGGHSFRGVPTVGQPDHRPVVRTSQRFLTPARS